MSASRPGAAVFVTVGTTKFDALIRACDRQALADALVERGYSRLIMQVRHPWETMPEDEVFIFTLLFGGGLARQNVCLWE
jgi:UDP-N-acetylglucosamine transferase subunit ALG13